MENNEYLGDGVYVDYDGYHIILMTEGNTIFLDSVVFASLIGYAKATEIIDE